MTLQDLLRGKGTDIFSITPDKSLYDVAHLLMKHRCGSLLVLEVQAGRKEPVLAGIITERDILRACAERKAPLEELRVIDYMTVDLVTGSPTDSVEDTMGLMTEHRIRHLPVMDNTRLVGLISIGDVVKAQHHQMAVENHYLKNYIQS